jgi:hypothetical protein
LHDSYDRNVFINCPFDDTYKELFVASIFAIKYCGYKPICSYSYNDASEGRITKLYRIVSECRLGLHDISATELDPNGLPRFNMPLELGIFLGARHFGNKRDKSKVCIIFDREQFRFQEFISDIGGQDVTPHNREIGKLIEGTVNWLTTYRENNPTLGIPPLPGSDFVYSQYDKFRDAAAFIAQEARLNTKDKLRFLDWDYLINQWMVMDLHGQAAAVQKGQTISGFSLPSSPLK